MHLLTGLVICILVVQRSSCWNNDFDERLDFKCPSHNQFIDNVISRHSNHFEDRLFQFSCKDIIPGGGDQGATCQHSGYVNNFDEPVDYNCPGNGYINGMKSYHDNGHEDRRWIFYCCSMPGKSLYGCSLTRWTNDFDSYQDYRVPDGYIMAGVSSVHNNGYQDRRFRYRICRVWGK